MPRFRTCVSTIPISENKKTRGGETVKKKTLHRWMKLAMVVTSNRGRQYLHAVSRKYDFVFISSSILHSQTLARNLLINWFAATCLLLSNYIFAIDRWRHTQKGETLTHFQIIQESLLGERDTSIDSIAVGWITLFRGFSSRKLYIFIYFTCALLSFVVATWFVGLQDITIQYTTHTVRTLLLTTTDCNANPHLLLRESQ